MSGSEVSDPSAPTSPMVKARIAGFLYLIIIVGGIFAQLGVRDQFMEGGLYLTNSFAHFVAPAVGARVFPFLMASGIAEVSFCAWLLLVGVNTQRWKEQAARQTALSP